MGGLVIKKILALAEEHDKYSKILDSTSSIIFLGVPHRYIYG